MRIIGEKKRANVKVTQSPKALVQRNLSDLKLQIRIINAMNLTTEGKTLSFGYCEKSLLDIL